MGEMIELVARASRAYEVQGVLYADGAGSCYRVVSGAVALGGDHVDLASAQGACDLLNSSAVLAAIEQAGFVIVPREPTEAMIAEGSLAKNGMIHMNSGHPVSDIWQAMLAAAPSQDDATGRDGA